MDLNVKLPPLEEPCWQCGKQGYDYDPQPHELRGPGCYHCNGKGGRPTELGEAILALVAHYGKEQK